MKVPRGGARVGAGGPKKPRKLSRPKVLSTSKGETPLEYMLAVIHDEEADASRRDRMAVAAAPYLHAKKDYGSLKDQRRKAADKTAAGKFGAEAFPPKLVVNSR
jgi:anthranilate phosphoribosyltransferase